MKPHPLSLGLLLALQASAALAQSDPAPAADDGATLDTIVITGTRAANRTVATASSPIDVITPAALEATGTNELATALSRALPSLNFPRPAITDGTDAVRPAQLRGLAPDQVLVLVNGKRRHTTALINLNGSQGRGASPVDLNAIPISAIQRVEVLRDGASAQYGSDAIAGVINIVLKGGDHGGGVALSGGQYAAGDGRNAQLSADAGFKLGDSGALHLAAEARDQDQTDRARPYVLAPGVTVRPVTAPPPGVVAQRFGDPEVRQYAVSANADVAVNDALSFYGFANASRRDALSNGLFRAAGDTRNLPAVYPDGFLPRIRNIAEDRAAVIGLRGLTALDWDVDLSYNYGSSDLSFGVENSLNRSVGATSQRDFHAGALEISQHVLNLDVRRGFDLGGLSSPLSVAWGLEWRGEGFGQRAGEPASYLNGGALLPDGITPAPSGAQVFPGFQPADAGDFDRESYAAYLDLEADVTDRFNLGLAVRAEEYSDFGSTTSGKLSARFDFNERVALRGTVSTGFRAPSLQQQFFRSTATSFIGGIPFDVRTFRVGDAAAVALGAEPLKAEESRNASLGLVLQPVDNLYVTVDAYHIDIDDRIMLSENLTSALVRTFLNDPARNPGTPGNLGGGRYFTNAVDTRTRGVDVIATYRWALDEGHLDLTAGYNYNKTTVEKIAANPAALTAIDPAAVRIGRVEIGRLTVGAPRDKFQLGGQYQTGHWRFGANATRYGEFTVLFGNNPADTTRDQSFDAQWTLDLSGSYALGNWNFTLGADNVLNDYPDEVLFANSTNGQLPYSSTSPNGFNGAYVYARVGYTW